MAIDGDDALAPAIDGSDACASPSDRSDAFAATIAGSGEFAIVLEALATRGARRIDPVRWHLAEAMLRRASDHSGAARRAIDERLATLIDDLRAAVDRAEAAPGVRAEAGRRAGAPQGAPAPARNAVAGPLGALVAEAMAMARPASVLPAALAPHAHAHTQSLSLPLSQTQSQARAHAKSQSQAQSPSAPATQAGPRRRGAAPPVPVPPALAEPPGLRYFRRTWSRLKAEGRLEQARAALPANAGPLNSHHLVHRALASLHELAPAYCERIIGHIDDLLWIEAATGAAGPAAPARAEGERTGRGR